MDNDQSDGHLKTFFILDQCQKYQKKESSLFSCKFTYSDGKLDGEMKVNHSDEKTYIDCQKKNSSAKTHKEP